MPKSSRKADEEPLTDAPDVETASSAGPASAQPTTKSIPIKELSTGSRYDITDDDLNNSAVAKVLVRMFMSDMRRLRTDIDVLKEYREQYHAANEALLVALEKIRGMRESVGVSNILFAFGGAAIGLAFAQTTASHAVGAVGLAIVFFASGSLKPWDSWKKR
jgi:hypothetical protein